MALFKISKGLSANLDKQPKKEGNCWYTTDDSLFHIDISDTERQVLNASDAKTLSGAILSQSLNEAANEIPSSQVVFNAISNIPSSNVYHEEEALSDIIETYILNIDYSLLSFDTSDIVFDDSLPPGSDDSTTAKLGYAVLGKMVLGT